MPSMPTIPPPYPSVCDGRTIRSADGVELAFYHWPAPPTPRATVALVHGLAEHSGRYEALARRLNAAGIELVAVDLRGHGYSPGRRTWVTRFDEYLSDAEALLDAACGLDNPDGV